MTDTAQKDLDLRDPSGLWRPLCVSAFRDMLIADAISDIGTFMQNVGAAWLMVSVSILRQSRRLYGCWPLKGA
jgi:hypothetical protein